MNYSRIWKIFIVLPLILLVISSSAVFYGCSGTETETPEQIIKDITIEEANELIDENRGNSDFRIIDVRTPEEYSEGNLKNSVLIDYNGDDFEAKIGELDKDGKYLVYCKSGGRSRQAVDYMQEQGFNEVYNMLGGFTEWEAANLPAEY
jgi:rhodanese-related sulfurtransferase